MSEANCSPASGSAFRVRRDAEGVWIATTFEVRRKLLWAAVLSHECWEIHGIIRLVYFGRSTRGNGWVLFLPYIAIFFNTGYWRQNVKDQ